VWARHRVQAFAARRRNDGIGADGSSGSTTKPPVSIGLRIQAVPDLSMPPGGGGSDTGDAFAVPLGDDDQQFDSPLSDEGEVGADSDAELLADDDARTSAGSLIMSPKGTNRRFGGVRRRG